MTFSRSHSLTACLCLILLLLSIGAKAAEVPDPTPPLLAEAQRSLSHSKFELALEQVNRFLANAPKDVQGRFVKAVALSQTGKVDQAMALYTEISEDAPEMAEPYNNLAVLQAQQGQTDLARQSLEMAVRANPNYTVALENLGDLYARLALSHYKRAGSLEPQNKAVKLKRETLETVTGITPDQTGPRPLPSTRKTSTVPF